MMMPIEHSATVRQAAEERRAVAIVEHMMVLRGHAVTPVLHRCLVENADAVRDELVSRYGYVSDMPLHFARVQVASDSHPCGV